MEYVYVDSDQVNLALQSVSDPSRFSLALLLPETDKHEWKQLSEKNVLRVRLD